MNAIRATVAVITIVALLGIGVGLAVGFAVALPILANGLVLVGGGAVGVGGVYLLAGRWLDYKAARWQAEDRRIAMLLEWDLAARRLGAGQTRIVQLTRGEYE